MHGPDLSPIKTAAVCHAQKVFAGKKSVRFNLLTLHWVFASVKDINVESSEIAVRQGKTICAKTLRERPNVQG
jgi:hypothetical protein